jgi:hypothetical protein
LGVVGDFSYEGLCIYRKDGLFFSHGCSAIGIGFECSSDFWSDQRQPPIKLDHFRVGVVFYHPCELSRVLQVRLQVYIAKIRYNMIAGVAVGMSNNVIWLVWAIMNRSRPYAHKIISFVMLMFGAISFELLDFAPIWRVFDAHSVWHLCTVPLVVLYWDFLMQDSIYQVRQRKGKQSMTE